MAPKMEPKWSQHGSQIRSEAVLEGSRSLPKNRLKNESKIVDLGGGPWDPLGPPFWEHFGASLATFCRPRLERGSGGLLGGFWGRFWRRFWEDFGIILEYLLT